MIKTVNYKFVSPSFTKLGEKKLMVTLVKLLLLIKNEENVVKPIAQSPFNQFFNYFAHKGNEIKGFPPKIRVKPRGTI